MGAQSIQRERLPALAAIVLGFLAVSAAGVYAIYTQGWGLIFEVSYVVLVGIVFLVIADKMLLR